MYFELAFRLTEKLASRPSIDEISAELEVLKSEHASLQQSLQESLEKETKTKKKLEEKHAQAMAEMAEKLKNSQHRVKTLVSKAKTYELEATDIDELIFRKDFIFLACPLYPFLADSKSDHVIFCIYQRVSDMNGTMHPIVLG
jgi:glutamate racemase